MLKFLSGIICILLHWTKKLTLVKLWDLYKFGYIVAKGQLLYDLGKPFIGGMVVGNLQAMHTPEKYA